MRKSIVRVAGAYLAAGALTAVLVACGAGPRPTVTPTRGAAVPAASAASASVPGASTGAGAAASVPSASKKTYAKAPDMTIDQNKSYTALIKTSMGDITVALNAKDAPLTVNNFVFLARDGFYDGLTFHRIIKGFMIQGGDPLTKDPSKERLWGTGGPGHNVKAEFNDRSHQRGVISMARSQDPNSAGSQFFIVHGDASFLDRQYTAFGKLTQGDDVLEKIANTPCGGGGMGERSKPATRVEVTSVKIVPAQPAQ